MSAMNEQPATDAWDPRARREALIEQFEAAFRAGQRPAFEAFLPVEPSERRVVLIELAHAELEMRLKAGETACADDYLQRFPDLAADTVVARELRATESRYRYVEASATPTDTRGHHGVAPASVPLRGYELLGTLGRGGMGVVYKARHLKLNRLVAVKMILAGTDAGEEELLRFRKEAEAVAQLQHPNIVQIFDVGEHEGRPFFTMELVEGGSLANMLAGKPLPAEQAAPLLQALARAVHYAHQRGIVHRDLKPANILLAQNPNSDFSPRITDFGLAKRLDSTSGLTRTGAVIGTPSYMAPEQAAGQSQSIGPATDVYALGAILYETLTGRPPFRGETVLETLEQVRHVEPVPPSQLRPGLARDLETICLTALAKEPARRYASALAMAQDLELFCGGEPIRARRAGPVYRLYRKLRRRPLLAVSVLALALAGAIAAFVGPRAYRDRHVAVTVQEIEDRLQTPQLSEEYLRLVEGKIADLEEQFPDRAVVARRRLYLRFADVIREGFRDRLGADEAAPLQQAIGWLTPRDPELAVTLGKEVGQRLSEWKMVLQVAAPFEMLDRAFVVPKMVQPSPSNLSLCRPPGTTTDYYVAAQGTVAGNVKMTAVFDSSWEKAAQLGVTFNPGQGPAYSFLVTVPESFGVLGEPVPLLPLRATFGDARRMGKVVTMVIIRTDAPVARHTRLVQKVLSGAELFADTPPDGTLRIEVKREGERFTFQVNQRIVEFRDFFSIRATEPVRVSLYWPAEADLKALQLERQASPFVASELENGDDLYHRRDYEGARAWYEKAKRQAHSDAIRQEASYREGVCCLAMKRLDEAAALFQPLSMEASAEGDLLKGPCWPVLADCQLLLMAHRQNDAVGRASANAIIEKLIVARRGRRPGEFSSVVPFQDWESVIDAHPLGGSRAILRKPADLLADCERADKAAVLFESDELVRVSLRVDLAKLYHMAGRDTEALRTSYEVQREFQPLFETNTLWGSWALEQHCWLLRRKGELGPGALQAEKELNAWLLSPTGTLRKDAHGVVYFPLVERARIHAAREQWDQAEEDLLRFFALQAKETRREYHFHAAACLLQGFLHERRGDRNSALAAWRRGLIQAWAKENPADRASHLLAMGVNIALVNHGIMASLTGELSDQDAEDTVTRLLAAGSADVTLGALSKLVKIPPGVVREMWRGERGQAWARKIAFRDLSYAEYIYAPPRLMAAEFLHHGALPGPLSAAHDDLIWKVCLDLHSAYMEGTFTSAQVLSFGMAWKGSGLARLGPRAVDTAVLKGQPRLRGPLAYLLGHRSLANHPADAIAYFTIASEALPPDNPIRSLAQSELARLKTRPQQQHPP